MLKIEKENLIELYNNKNELCYIVYKDGICYNFKTGGDLPQWVLKIGKKYA